MRKLTLDRIVTVKAAIWKYQVATARKAEERPAPLTPEWKAIMQDIWEAQEAVTTNLGTSQTRTHSLLTGATDLSDYYDMATGHPLKAGN